MTFTYRAITANCGNDTLGATATRQITSQLSTEGLDFCLINCQEVKIKPTERQLKQQLQEPYAVVCIHSMSTQTKLNASGTGMATYLIYNKNKIQLNSQMQKLQARRSKNMLSGTAYNKGGLISRIQLTPIQSDDSTKPIVLETMSGHLDSNYAAARAQDWLVIQENLSYTTKETSTFEQLAAKLPHIRMAGYDANTRNQYQVEQTKHLWETDTAEIHGLKQFALGNHRYSDVSTYSIIKNAEKIESSKAKRKGQTEGGMLDFVDILDGRPSQKSLITDTTLIPPDDPSTKRDHAVVLSPTMRYDSPNDFERVKNLLASMLDKAAPKLATQIRELTDSPENRGTLVKVYHEFLSKDKGLLPKSMALYVAKLNHLKTHPTDREVLFGEGETLAPWFADITLTSDENALSSIREELTQDFSLLKSGNTPIKTSGIEKEGETTSEESNSAKETLDSGSFSPPQDSLEQIKQDLQAFITSYQNKSTYQQKRQQLRSKIESLSCLLGKTSTSSSEISQSIEDILSENKGFYYKASKLKPALLEFQTRLTNQQQALQTPDIQIDREADSDDDSDFGEEENSSVSSLTDVTPYGSSPRARERDSDDDSDFEEENSIDPSLAVEDVPTHAPNVSNKSTQDISTQIESAHANRAKDIKKSIINLRCKMTKAERSYAERSKWIFFSRTREDKKTQIETAITSANKLLPVMVTEKEIQAELGDTKRLLQNMRASQQEQYGVNNKEQNTKLIDNLRQAQDILKTTKETLEIQYGATSWSWFAFRFVTPESSLLLQGLIDTFKSEIEKYQPSQASM